jgi:hypothetical protein
MSSAESSPFVVAVERAIAAAHAALRSLDATPPTESTLPAARSVRRALGALLDGIDGRTTLRSGLDRAISSLGFALASLGGEKERPEDAPVAPGSDDVGRALAAVLEATNVAPTTQLDADPSRAPDRPRPRWRVAIGDPRVVDVPRASLLPPDTIRLPAPPAKKPPRKVALPGLDRGALLAQAEKLTADAALLAASTAAATEALAAVGAKPKGDLDTGSFLRDEATPPISELAFRRSLVRTHFEDVGMFGLQRMPLFGDDFAAVEVIEARLLASSDAVLAEADLLPELERLARDTPAPDPMRVFAMAFVGGSLDGRDALAAAERTLYAHDPHDPGIAEAFGAALAMSSHPHAGRVLLSLARADEAPVRAASLRALARRGPVDPTLLLEGCETAMPAVIAAALPALAVSTHPHAAALFSEVAARSLTSTDAEVAIALWEALALARHDHAAAAPSRHLTGALGGAAAIALALVADAEGASALVTHVGGCRSPASLVALGWLGSLAAVPTLLDALGDDDLALAAGRALERLLGTTVLEAVDVDPESLEAMEPVAVRTPSMSPRGTLSQAIQRPDEEPEASPDRMHLPPRVRDVWQKRFAEVRARLPRGGEGLRVRRGEPYLPSMSLAELGKTGEELCPSFAERQLLVRELAFRTGRPVPFSPEDLVVVQRRRLVELQSLLGVPAAAGSFATSGRTS